ncbi:hypothetical protein FA13DRAFT_1798686 [Coprinellus micaceus]|uniref:Uncharacterized protein n=1 Tax=Coprinellus micaceus TaxID=71717 RepID=A0A4Y7SL22_COPMI|nr:hypothetical protein FA13DRAFT_1798686 [Coprinellus micaceus]
MPVNPLSAMDSNCLNQGDTGEEGTSQDLDERRELTPDSDEDLDRDSEASFGSTPGPEQGELMTEEEISRGLLRTSPELVNSRSDASLPRRQQLSRPSLGPAVSCFIPLQTSMTKEFPVMKTPFKVRRQSSPPPTC